MLVFEYWSHLEEFAAGQHSEIGAYFLRETEGLIAETSVMLEASPVWGQGVPPPASSESSAE